MGVKNKESGPCPLREARIVSEHNAPRMAMTTTPQVTMTPWKGKMPCPSERTSGCAVR